MPSPPMKPVETSRSETGAPFATPASVALSINPELRNGNGGCLKAWHHCRAAQSGPQAHAVQTLVRCLMRPFNAKRLDCARFIAAFSRHAFTRSAARIPPGCPPASVFGSKAPRADSPRDYCFRSRKQSATRPVPISSEPTDGSGTLMMLLIHGRAAESRP